MTDAPPIAPDDAPEPPARRAPWLSIAIAILVLALVGAGAGWWWLNNRAIIPDWDRLPEIVLAAPAGDAFAPDTPWVQVRLAPLRPDAANTIRAAVGYREGTPVPAAGAPYVTAVTAQPVTGEPAGPESVVIEAGENDELSAPLPLDQAGWHRISAEVAGAAMPAEFFLLIPDPNINGPNAVPGFSSSAEAEAVFERGLAATTALQSVRYTEWIADGAGNSAVSEHTFVAGKGGSPPALAFRITGGMEIVIIGSTRWTKPPGVADWQRQEGGALVPPSAWGEEYSEATEFTLLGEETIDGEPTQLVAFVAPEQTEPRRRTVAWYLWWVGTETGQVRREAMVSRRHYMHKQFSDFNEPIVITPPDEPGTPAAATPGRRGIASRVSAPAPTPATATRGIPEASPLLVAIAPAIFLLFWSGGYAAGKVGLGYTGPFTLLAVRYGVVLLILAPLALVMRPPLPRTPAVWVHLAVVGFLIQGVYFGLGYIALDTTLSSAAVALILSLQPILVAIIAPRIAGERVGVWGWIGLGLGLAGAALVILARSTVEALPLAGVLAAIGALAGITLGTLYEKRFGVAQHPVTSNAVQYVAGLAVAFPLAWALEEHAVTWAPPFVLALTYLVVCNSLIAMTLLLMMIRVGKVSRVSALFFLVPPMAALIGWVVLGEEMPPLAWVGLGLAAAGVALASRAERLPEPGRLWRWGGGR